MATFKIRLSINGKVSTKSTKATTKESAFEYFVERYQFDEVRLIAFIR